MGISDTKKVDILWKKLIHGVTETDALNKDGTNETIASPVLTLGHNIWADSSYVTATPPETTNSYIKVYTGSSAVKLIRDVTVSGNRAWRAVDSSDGITPLIDWIPPSIGPDYLVQIYVGNPNTGGDKLNIVQQNNEWVFDYTSGVLYFPNCVPANISYSSEIWLEGYRYIGSKGVPSGGSGGGGSTIVGGVAEVQIAGSCYGKPVPNDVLMRFVVATRMKFSLNLPDSQARCRVIPTNSVDLQLLRNDSYFGKITFAPDLGNHYAKFYSLETVFFPKDELLVVAPNVADSTLEDIEWTLLATPV